MLLADSRLGSAGRLAGWCLVFVLGGLTSRQGSADWSAYRGDAQRSATTSDQLPDRLQLRWLHQAGRPPAPAWPAPARSSLWQNLQSIQPRVIEDRVFHPLAVGDAIYYGSSAEDAVVCLAAESGQVRWRFFCDGPVRFAPWIDGDQLIFGSDDGSLYAVDRHDGRLRWRRSLAPEQRWVSGNGRLISAWPIRTGVVVADGVVYIAAGLFPTEGTFLHAVRADDGESVWVQPLSGYSPQGYLLASAERLYIPTGRANPISVPLAVGSPVTRYDGVGGSFALLVDDLLVAGGGNDGTLVASRSPTAERLVEYAGQQMVVTSDRSFLQTHDRLVCIDRGRQLELIGQQQRLTAERERLSQQLKQAAGDRQAERRLRAEMVTISQTLDSVSEALEACRLWEVENDLASSMILAANRLVTGGDGQVAMFDAHSGERVWQAAVEGEVRGLAVAAQQLLVSTTAGYVLAFAAESASAAETLAQPDALGAVQPEGDSGPDRSLDRWQALRARLPVKAGYCLVAGIGDPRTPVVIAEQTGYQVLVIDPDPARVELLRQTLARDRLYGTGSVVACSLDPHQLPITDYVASLIVIDDTERRIDWSEAELRRLLRPFGGQLVRLTQDAGIDADFVLELGTAGGGDRLSMLWQAEREALDGAGGWQHLYGSPANTSYSPDRNISAALRLQWFGGPGPSRMVDRHLRAQPPLADSGRLFVFGENVVTGVDPFTGLEQWVLDLPDSQRYSMPYDGGYAATAGGGLWVAVQDQLWHIDTAGGQVTDRWTHPGPAGHHWGYAAVVDDKVVGTAQLPAASRTKPSRESVDLDYRSGQGLVTSRLLFMRRLAEDQLAWSWERGSSIFNCTITIDRGRIFFVELRGTPAAQPEEGRVALSAIKDQPVWLVAIDLDSGRLIWERPLDLTGLENIIYLQADAGQLLLSGSSDGPGGRGNYRLVMMTADTGREQWRQTHVGRSGDLYHGEQVQHPVLMPQLVVSEPYLFDRVSGELFHPDGLTASWSFQRPGHSCGTITGAGQSLFFRADNPVRLNLGSLPPGQDRFLRLAPTRTGCWINAIPAQGLVLIPEASAGCVCHYSLQTSIGFLPVPQ
jgi:outer membrane protein assembly factor BamB